MAKTFEEWFDEANSDGQLEGKAYHVGKYFNEDYFSYNGFEEVMKEAWEASRENMTYKDI